MDKKKMEKKIMAGQSEANRKLFLEGKKLKRESDRKAFWAKHGMKGEQ